MAIKEFREFFFRKVTQSSGIKSDQESTFPIQYYIQDVNGREKKVRNRFNKGDFPSESVFKKLFESITFKLNPEDTASTTVQGLVKTVTGNQVRDDDNGSDGFSKTIQPSQTTKVTVVNQDARTPGSTSFLNNGTPIPITTLEAVKEGGGSEGKNYKVKFKETFYSWLLDVFNKLQVYIDAINIEAEVEYGDFEEPLVEITKEKQKTVGDIDDLTKGVVYKLTIKLPSQGTTITDFFDVGDLHIKKGATGFNLSTGLGSGKWAGWAIADGRNGTVNLQGRAIIGWSNISDPLDNTNSGPHADYNTLLSVHGQKNVALTTPELPSHSHNFTKEIIELVNLDTSVGANGTAKFNDLTGTFTTTSVGNGEAHNNVPPSVVLLIIEKIA